MQGYPLNDRSKTLNVADGDERSFYDGSPSISDLSTVKAANFSPSVQVRTTSDLHRLLIRCSCGAWCGGKRRRHHRLNHNFLALDHRSIPSRVCRGFVGLFPSLTAPTCPLCFSNMGDNTQDGKFLLSREKTTAVVVPVLGSSALLVVLCRVFLQCLCFVFYYSSQCHGGNHEPHN